MRRTYGFLIVLVTLLLGLAAVGTQAAGLQPQWAPVASGAAAQATAVPDGTRKLPPADVKIERVAPDPSYRPAACTAPVVNVSATTGNQAETQVVVNPTNPNNLVAFSNIASGSSIFRAYSMDNGATWTRGTVVTNVACCDAQGAFDLFGNLFIVYINASVNQVNVILSTDGGATFAAPVTAGVGSIDQPSLAVGNGSVWVDWNLGGTMQLRGAPVTGLGVWGPFNAVQSVPTGTGNFGGIAVGPGPNGGKVIVTYQNPSGGEGPATIYANVDVDGLGAGGLGPRITVSTTNVGGFDYIPAQSTRSVDAEAGVVWDGTGGPFNNRIYLIYTEEIVNESNDTEIYVRTSDNDGTTWSAPVRVNDDPLGPIRSQFLPYIALDRSTGTVAAGWHDARNDTGVVGVGGTNTTPNDDSEYFASYSTNGGLSWAANTRLSGGWSNDNAAANGVDYGDYVAQDAYGGKFVAVWADNSNCDGTNANGTLGAFDLYMGQLALPVQGTPTPTRTGTPPTATRTSTPVPPTLTPTATPTIAGQSCNPAPITINDAGPASPYPSNIVIAGAGSSLSQIQVQINGLNHTWPDDIDMLLVGPNGGKVLLMSDAGGSNDLVGVNLTFADGSPALPDSTQITSGTYAPTDYEAGDVFPAPAPAGPYGTSLNTAFVGSNPNGTWSLYIVDDAGADVGAVTGGWCLAITATGGGATPSATGTAPVLTGTATRTATVPPVLTGTATRTATVPPVLTGTATRTATALLPTITLPPILTNTPSATAPVGASATATACAAPASWTSQAPVPVTKGRAVGVTFGTSIYLFGGRTDNTTYTADVYRYDTATNTWTLLGAQLPDLQTSNMAGGVLTFPEGPRLFVVGGNGTGSSYTGRALAFDPVAGTFAPKAAWPAAPARLPGGWAVANNKFYIFGGIVAATQGYADNWVYDPTTDAWAQLPTNLSLARGYIATELMPDGLIYLAGGSQVDAGVLTDETLFEKYNPATNTITTGPALPVAKSNNSGYRMNGKFVVPSGGYNVVGDETLIYDPALNSWSTGAPTLFPVRNYSKGYGPDGAIYVIGGLNQDASEFYAYNQRYGAGACVTATVSPVVTIPPTTVASATRTATVGASATRTAQASATTAPPTATATACPAQFQDVPPTDPFYVFIRCLVCRGIISGYTCGGPGEPCVPPTNYPYFRTGNPVTRAQVAKMVSNSANLSAPVPSTQQTFQDVPPSHPFWIWIERLAGLGYISGYSCGGPGEPCGPGNRPYYRPSNPVTRGQLAKIVSNAAQFADPVPSTQQTFQDVPPSNPFWLWVERVALHGVISGYGCGGVGEPCVPPGNRPYYRPGAASTRGQTAKIVANAFFPGCATPSRPAAPTTGGGND